MNSRVSIIDTGVGASFIASAVIHLAVFLLLVWWGQLFSPQMSIQETYYVDVVTLPTADPRLGGSAQKPAETESVPVPVAAPPITPPPVSKSTQKGGTKFVKPVAPRESVESESAFAERMAKLEGQAEAQQYEEKMKRLSSKTKAASNAKAGTPGVSGAEAGSRYADYIKSRLADALKLTSFYTTRKPEVIIRLIIAADGKLLSAKQERSTGDVAFEKSVMRAIELASKKFTAPPNHTKFEIGIKFDTDGISNGVLH
jgi:colicin import membrane protein